MNENKYKTNRIIDGKPPLRTVIVDDNGKIVNKNPTKEELKDLKNESRKFRDTCVYTDKELLNYLTQFYEKNGRPPKAEDFKNNSEYPSFKTYQRRFGSWSNALKLVGMDLDTRVMQGYLDTNQEKGRHAEINVINHFMQHPIDLAGENCTSPCDGICPNGKTYEVKSSKLYIGGYYTYCANNKHKDSIKIYYFLAYNDDGILRYMWRVPGEIVENDYFYVSINDTRSRAKFTVENLKEYNIIDKYKATYKKRCQD